MPYLFSISSAFAIVLAWHMPDTPQAAILGWLGSLTLIPLLYKENFRANYLHTIICTAFGMHWVYDTINYFGNFGSFISFLIFLLFIFTFGLQTPIAGFIFKILPSSLSKFGLRASLAWVTTSYLPLRIFPWEISHTQLSFPYITQIADLAGSLLVSLVVLSVCESLYIFIVYKKRNPAILTPLFILVASLIYGSYKIEYFESLDSEKLEVRVVQANINAKRKNNINYFESNFEDYKNLTRLGINSEEENLIVWPEAVYSDWIPEAIENSKQLTSLPDVKNSALIFGTLTYRDKKTLFNSGMAIYPGGKIPKPYHKQALMPFGEYMPLAKTFPFIDKLHPYGSGFTAGKTSNLFKIPFKDSKPTVGTLICYEDIVPRLARNATKAGANLLVNLTNDAWFGKSVAGRQHHIIASFRAIENRRTLVRSTNTGFTAVTNHIGKTVSYIPEHSAQILYETVNLINFRTIYTDYVGELPYFLMLLIFSCILISKIVKP